MNKNQISITSSGSSNMSGNSTVFGESVRLRNGLQPQRGDPISLSNLRNVESWTRKQILGAGNFGKITLWLNTEDSNSKMIAIKECKPFTSQNRDYNMKQWKQEIAIMNRLECVNVVKGFPLPDSFKNLKVEIPLLAMEYCSGGDLRNILNKPQNCCGLEEHDVRQVLFQISNAIQYLHKNDIVHRDIKPENILSHTDPTTRKTLYKLTDLGYAKELTGSTKANTFVGTWEYLAPELFQNQPQNSNVDNWSFGLLAFEIIVGRRPFFYDRTMDCVIKELKTKNSEHICLEIDLDSDQVSYSKVIPPNTLICDSFKVQMENWLRIVLEYEPNKRGGNESFQKIKDIVNLPMIRIFKIDTYKTLSMTLNVNTTLESVQDRIQQNLSIPKKNQCLLLPNGKSIRKDFGRQIIETWFTSETCTEHYNPLEIAVFDYSQKISYRELHFNIDLPPLVVEILCSSFNRAQLYEVMKKAWKESIWTARDLITKHTSLQQAFKSTVLSSVALYNRSQTLNRSLLIATNEALTIAHLLKQYTTIQIESLSTQNDLDILSSQTLMCKNNVEIINACLKACNNDIRKHFEQNNRIIPKFPKESFLYDSLFREDCEPTLMKRYQELIKGYEKYRTSRSAEPGATEMILNRVTTMFMHIEKLFEPFLKNINTCLKFMHDINSMLDNCKIITQRITDIKSQIFKAHISSFNSNNDNPRTTLTRQRSLLLDKNITNVRLVLETINTKLATFQSEQFVLSSNESSLNSLELSDLFF